MVLLSMWSCAPQMMIGVATSLSRKYCLQQYALTSLRAPLCAAGVLPHNVYKEAGNSTMIFIMNVQLFYFMPGIFFGLFFRVCLSRYLPWPAFEKEVSAIIPRLWDAITLFPTLACPACWLDETGNHLQNEVTCNHHTLAEKSFVLPSTRYTGMWQVSTIDKQPTKSV